MFPWWEVVRRPRIYSTIYCICIYNIYNKRSIFAFCLSSQVLHSLVCSVEKQAATASGCPLLIHCKNFQVLSFVVPRERECHDVHLSLQRLSQPGKLWCHVDKASVWWCLLLKCGFRTRPAYLKLSSKVGFLWLYRFLCWKYKIFCLQHKSLSTKFKGSLWRISADTMFEKCFLPVVCISASLKIQYWSGSSFHFLCFCNTNWRFCPSNLSCQPILCLAESYEELYCFSYKPNVGDEERRQEWDFLDLKADYSRMGLPNSLWKLSPVNRRYKVSERTSVVLFYPNTDMAVA